MLAPNTLLQNRYIVHRSIGKGGMGAVYEATDTRLDCTVALKETLFSSNTMRRAFEREARLLARLRHRSLPKVSDHFVEDTQQFLVMEFIPGEDLSVLLERNGGRFPASDIVDWVLRWAEQLLDALDYLHTQSLPITHRDIKPQNLKLTPRGDIILLDFGLAKGTLAQLSTFSSSTSLSIGGFTPNYAPLEQIHGADPDPRGDLYSLAATLYHLLTGVRPPDALSRAAALLQDDHDILRLANELNPRVPYAVAIMLHHALALNIDERPVSAQEMLTTLHGIVASGSGDDLYGSKDVFQRTRILPRILPSELYVEQDRLDYEASTDNGITDQHSDISIGTLLSTLQTGSPVLSVACSPDGQLVAVGSEDKTVGLWRLHDASLLRSLEGHIGSVRSVAFSPDGQLLATGSDDKTIRLWWVKDGTLSHMHDMWTHPTECVVFSPDGRFLASGGWGGTICIWEVDEGCLAKTMTLSSGFIHSVAFSPDGQMLAVGCYDGTIQLWDMQQKTVVHTFVGHTSFVLSVAFSPSGHILAASGGSSDIFLWRIRDGRLLDKLKGHTNFVRSVAFSPDGQILVSGSEDHTIRLWRVNDGSHVFTLRESTDGIMSVVFSPDGHRLIAGSHDTKIRLWQLH